MNHQEETDEIRELTEKTSLLAMNSIIKTCFSENCLSDFPGLVGKFERLIVASEQILSHSGIDSFNVDNTQPVESISAGNINGEDIHGHMIRKNMQELIKLTGMLKKIVNQAESL